ncbi:MAG: iron ABC transporter permease [Candidatus Omnitrophota bacterium]
MANKYFRNLILVLISILIVSILIAIFKGSVNLGVKELFFAQNSAILNLRIWRVIVAIISGIGLSVSGIVLQVILRNPLAEPYLLGTSSGAGLGAIIAIMLGLSGLYMPLFAFIGAILTVIFVCAIATQGNKINEQSLILSGVIVSVAISAVIVFLVSISGNQSLHELTWWLWGSFSVYDFKLVILVSFIVLIGSGVVYAFWQDLNAISLGEEDAIHLGINIERVKKILIVVCSLITASLVCICGIIGFVGLMIPHMVRLAIGINHRMLIPLSAVSAAIFMVICDVVSRTAFQPLEIPIGVITAIFGAPVFILLLKRRQLVK